MLQRVICHIGTEKTGSTTLQAYLHKNADQLSAQGVCYPTAFGRGSQSEIAAICLDPEQDSDLFRRYRLTDQASRTALRDQVREGLQDAISPPAHTLITSSEHFSSRLRKTSEIEALKSLLTLYAARIDIVVYLRPQADLALSRYSEAIKNGRTDPYDPSDYDFEKMNRHWRYNYVERLRPWRDVFGAEAITVRPFQSSQLREGDLLSDFASLAGFDRALLQPLETDLNPALDARTLEFLRLWNVQIEGQALADLKPLRRKLVKRLERLSDGPKLRLDPATKAILERAFEPGNHAVASAYLGDPNRPLFEAATSKTGELYPDNGYTAEEMAAVFARLWSDLA